MNDADALFRSSVQSTVVSRAERKRGQSKSMKQYPGRFIPNRDTSAANSDQHIAFGSGNGAAKDEVKENSAFNDTLAEALLKTNGSSKILSFKQQAPAPDATHIDRLRIMYAGGKDKKAKVAKSRSGSASSQRYMRAAPYRVLDAPGLIDDYYMNCLDWADNNVLAVALEGTVYLWDASSGEVSVLFESDEDEDVVSSVRWVPGGSHLAVGWQDSAAVQIWDVAQQRMLRSMGGHHSKVGALSWNGSVCTSGSKDTNIHHHDVRVRNHIVGSITHHEAEVCGLAWSPDGKQLATGGNDNRACVFDSDSNLVHEFDQHTAAVKALAWCPFQDNVLATGAGTADRHIRVFSTRNGALLNKVDTKAQVCSLTWSVHNKELLSSHGHTQTALSIWNYPTLKQVGELAAHTSRVLYTARSPDGTSVCSVGADETMRFWNVWGETARKKKIALSKIRSKPQPGKVKIRTIR